MSDAYSREWRQEVKKSAAAGHGFAGGRLSGHQRTLLRNAGGESFFGMIGADAVGMSTVPEVITGNHAGLKVLGVSCISNMAAGISQDKITAEEVNETTQGMQGQIKPCKADYFGYLDLFWFRCRENIERNYWLKLNNKTNKGSLSGYIGLFSFYIQMPPIVVL